MKTQEYAIRDSDVLQAAQKRLLEKRKRESIGSIVPLPERHAEAERDVPEVAPCSSASEDDSPWTLLPPGEYTLAFLDETKFFHPIWKRVVWNISMKIMDEGAHFGKLIPYYLNAIPKKERPKPGRYITSAFLIAAEMRPPKDLWRRRPSWFMGGCAFRARVRTSKRDSHGVELPEAGHKSKVECLLERVAGTPPCLRGGKP